MELGATVCLPNGAPRCEVCPVGPHCLARKNGTIDDLPVRKPKKAPPSGGYDRISALLRKPCGTAEAAGTACLAGLYEFPHLPGILSAEETIKPQKTGGSPRTIWKSS